MILDRYIRREIFEKLMWIIGFLILILTSHRFVDYLADAASGKIPADLVLNMLAMKMLAIMPRLLPIALFLSAILALTRLSGDKELTVISSTGVADNFQFVSVFKLSFIYGLFVFVISFFVSPWAEARVNELKAQARQESDISGISAGRFKEFSKGDRVVYVEGLSEDRESMDEVFLQVRQNQQLGVLTSDSAGFRYDKKTDGRYILFENGYRYVGEPGIPDYQITEYRKYGVLMDEEEQVTNRAKVGALPSIELLGSELVSHKAELQWRLSFVIASLLLPLFAVILNKYSFGENRYVSMMTGILVYLIYSNLLSIARTLMIKGDVHPGIGLWWVHVSLIIIIFFSIKFYNSKHRRRKSATP